LFSETTARIRENASRQSAIQRVIISRRGFEYLDTLDAPASAVSPETPNRWLMAAAGLGAGLLIGAITLRLRRPAGPTLQPA
jgi:uncharacterized protein involved in exopolysaccharide biosynthesis